MDFITHNIHFINYVLVYDENKIKKKRIGEYMNFHHWRISIGNTIKNLSLPTCVFLIDKDKLLEFWNFLPEMFM